MKACKLMTLLVIRHGSYFVNGNIISWGCISLYLLSWLEQLRSVFKVVTNQNDNCNRLSFRIIETSMIFNAICISLMNYKLPALVKQCTVPSTVFISFCFKSYCMKICRHLHVYRIEVARVRLSVHFFLYLLIVQLN